uniref:Uncharacterized protein n=1 Tax=Oryza nivara TaxID=4536 RepID=A0A0E0HV41_ORYNI
MVGFARSEPQCLFVAEPSSTVVQSAAPIAGRAIQSATPYAPSDAISRRVFFPGIYAHHNQVTKEAITYIKDSLSLSLSLSLCVYIYIHIYI